MKRTEHVEQSRNFTQRQLALIELLADIHDARTQREKGKAAGVSGQWVSMLLRKPEFRAAVEKRRAEIIGNSVNGPWKALVDTASVPGREGAADRKTLFQALGVVGSGTNVVTNVTQTVQTTDEDREQRIAEIRSNRIAALKG